MWESTYRRTDLIPTREHLAPAATRSRHPLRYWLTVACAVGVPNVVRFDSSGLTHNAGLFNASSLGAITLSAAIAYALLSMHLLTRTPLLLRALRFDAALWLSLLALLACSTLLGPANRLAPGSHTDLFVGAYRLFEWLTAFLLVLSLYSREPEQTGTDMIVRVMGTVCWINILLVWALLPVWPSQVYGDPMDGAESAKRLGGLLIHPIGLGLYSEIAFFYCFLFSRGWRQWGGCGFAALTLFLTYARAEEAAFVVTFFLYLLVLSRRVTLRAAGFVVLGVSAAAGAVFHERVLAYAGRGHGLSNITTLSERTYVWQAAMQALALRPWMGYGYVNGVKNALREQWRFAHWIPPHCHNELLQAAVSGGLLAGALVLLLYLRTLFRAARHSLCSRKDAFLFVAFIQLVVLSFGEPILTNPISRSGAIFLLVFIGVAARSRPAQRRAAPAWSVMRREQSIATA